MTTMGSSVLGVGEFDFDSLFSDGEPSVRAVKDRSEALDYVESNEVDCVIYADTFDEHAISFIRDLREIDPTLPVVTAEPSTDRASLPTIRRAESTSTDDRFVEGILDLIPDAFYMLDLNGFITHWNDRVEEITGYDTDEIDGLHALEFVPDEDEAYVGDAIFRVLNEGNVETIESAMVTKDGTEIPHEFNALRVRNDDGDVVGLVGTGREITERKDHARKLRRLHEATRRFITTESADDVYRAVVAVCENELSMPRVCVYVPDDDALMMEPTVWSDSYPETFGSVPELPVEQSLVGAVFRARETQLYPTMDGIEPYVTDADIESALIVPIGDRAVLLAVASHRNRFDDSSKELAEMVAADAAAALGRR